MTRQTSLTLAVLATLCVATLTACGSQVDPRTAALANGGAATYAGGGAVAGIAPDGTPLVPTDLGEPAVQVASDTGGSSEAGSAGEGGSNAPSGGGDTSATGGVKAADCTGLRNQTGVTDSQITVANVSDISGPVPGLFASAQEGAAAYVQYFNATAPDGLCGRKLALLALDSRTDSVADQAAYTRACDEAFAVVGSVSITDSGGAATAEKCGIPDIRSNALTPERMACPVCFAAQSSEVGVIPTGSYELLLKTQRAATEKAAFLYINVGGSPAISQALAEAADAKGFGVKLRLGIDASEFNYAPYVQQLKDNDIGYVNFVGAVQHATRFAQAMEQQSYRPDVFQVTQTQYVTEYAETGGSAVEGTILSIPHIAFAEPSAPDELKLYLAWLDRTQPGATPTSFGLFAWSATRLFVETALKVGGDLDRESFIQQIRTVQDWTANGMHAPMDVGAKQTYNCLTVNQLTDGQWRQISPGKYICGDAVRTSLAR
jgi:ABC-type branched-subunit amino acid transport system substrate-binding protein